MLTGNWLVTIPKTIQWEDWMNEVADARARALVLFYKLPFRIDCNRGDRCFILWNGKIRGWLPVQGYVKHDGFVCETTGKVWSEGHYLERIPVFHPIDGPEMRGFQGIRRLPMNFLESILDRPR